MWCRLLYMQVDQAPLRPIVGSTYWVLSVCVPRRHRKNLAALYFLKGPNVSFLGDPGFMLDTALLNVPLRTALSTC